MCLENNYIAFCLAEFRKAGFTKSIYKDFDEASKAISKLIEILASRLISEVAKMQYHKDVLAFVLRYEAENKKEEREIAFKQLCKSIFVILPKLKLSSTANSVFPNPQNADISGLMNLNTSIMSLCQDYGMLMVAQEAIGTLLVSEEGWSFHLNDDDYYNKIQRFGMAVRGGALDGYCDNSFIHESFIDTYREVFSDVEDQLYKKIFTTPFVCNANMLTEAQFIKIMNGAAPRKGIIDLTDIVSQNLNSPCIKGLLFSEDNSNLLMAYLKPHKCKFRTRFRPILKINVDGIDRYITTQDIYYEAMSQLASGQFSHNDLPDEWKQVKKLADTAKIISKRHSDILEDEIEKSLKKENFPYLRNVKSISNVSLEKASATINHQLIKGRKVGEIDFIIIDESSECIFVVDAKYIKPTFFFTSFPVDADKFRKEGGYEDKLAYKINWLADNIELLAGDMKRTDILNYKVDGFFITDNLVYYSLFSRFPIVPVSNLGEYILTKDRYCFLPNI